MRHSTAEQRVFHLPRPLADELSREAKQLGIGRDRYIQYLLTDRDYTPVKTKLEHRSRPDAPLSWLKQVAYYEGLDLTHLLKQIEEAKTDKNDDIRWDDGFIYLTSRRAFYEKNDLDPLRIILRQHIGTIRKFGKRYYLLMP